MRLLRQPLVHFLLGGALLFVLYGWIASPRDQAPERIVVSETRVTSLVSSFERAWLRPPTEAELQGLIDDHVREEILYREALVLGLDRDDLVVRRRLRQKMEFLNEDLSLPLEPSDEDLRAYLEANADGFRVPPRTTFEQIFLDPERSDGNPRRRAADLLERLRAAAPESYGDPTLLPSRMQHASPREIDDTFGPGFADDISALPQAEWSGPVASSFGLHLVRVGAREPERMPPLEEVRDAVGRDWSAERRREANERFYQSLRSRYRVEVRGPTAESVEP